jgi:hypothetical protein
MNRRQRRAALKPAEASFNTAEFKQRMVAMAEANRAALDGTMDPVHRLLESADVTFGVWQESNGEYEIALVKGWQVLAEIASGDKTAEARMTAIPCGCAEQAEALRLYADPDRRH